MIHCFSVYDVADRGDHKAKPLLIAGAGPSWDDFPWGLVPDNQGITIFALNHTICELYRRSGVWWVSNDHDRTFQSRHVSKVVPPRLINYSPWRTITQKKFIPGELGDMDWVDHKGQKQPPMSWRLPAPDESTIAYYTAGSYMQGCPHWVHNGESVLELALEVATLWGFDPIVLVGCDQSLTPSGRYYARTFHWKATPPRILRGKIHEMRNSLIRNRTRWSAEVYIVTDLWKDPPFHLESSENAIRLLNGEGAWKVG